MNAPAAPAIPPLPPRGGLRRRVLAGETTIGSFANLGSVVAAELLARAGFDWIIVDLEHGLGTESELLAQLYAVQSTPAAAVVRAASSERLRIGRALDLGADGVMVPRLETAAEVAEALSWMRYPPAGVRGLALPTRGAGYGEVAHGDIAVLNSRILGVFQVESPAAVEAAPDLAAMDGVDCLFVGPTDLSHAMGIPGRLSHPDFTAALDRVVAACRGAGKAPGILLRDPAGLAAALDRGFTFLGLASDSGYLSDGARAAVSRAREILTG